MRRTASEIIRNLEMRIARLERQAARGGYEVLEEKLVQMTGLPPEDADQTRIELQVALNWLVADRSSQRAEFIVRDSSVKARGNKITFEVKAVPPTVMDYFPVAITVAGDGRFSVNRIM